MFNYFMFIYISTEMSFVVDHTLGVGWFKEAEV